MALSIDQENAFNKIKNWLKMPTATKQVFVLGGAAGTGKTFLTGYIEAELDYVSLSAVYTGGGALRMIENGIKGAKTIHSSIYNCVKGADGKPIFILKTLEEMPHFDYFKIDESSMVDSVIFADLLRFGKKILFVGDHEQLPPVNPGKSGNNSIMKKCDAILDTPHRVALENPLIWASYQIRRGKFRMREQIIGGKIYVTNKEIPELMMKVDQIITVKHKNRIRINRMIRNLLDYGDDPIVGDKIVCKQNTKISSFSPMLKGSVKMVNSMIGHIDDIKGRKTVELERVGNEPIHVPALKIDFKPTMDVNTYRDIVCDWKSFVNDRKQEYKADTKELNFFEYAYCISLYASQGNEFGSVYYEHDPFGDSDIRRRMLYTGVTRAKDKLVLKF